MELRPGTGPTSQFPPRKDIYFHTIVYNQPFAYDTKDTFTTSLSSFLRLIRMSEWSVPWYIYHGREALVMSPRASVRLLAFLHQFGRQKIHV